MTFSEHVTYRVEADGRIERGTGQLPSAIRLPALSVTISPTASAQSTARLLRRLADELEGSSL